MMALLTIIATVLLINLIVVLHELGHYIPSRLYGRPVKTFSVGFGKEIIGRTDSHGTRWKISLIPVGGYVMLDDGDRDATDWPSIGMLGKVSWVGFALISMGGVIVNFVTAWIYIWAVSGKVWSVFELLNTFIAGIPTAIVSTFSNPGSPNNFTGPIGLIDIFSDPKNLIVLFPIVSLGLAVTNLIPLPALDGGQFLFGSIEHIRQKAFSRRAQIALIGLSVVALIALTIASTVSDIVRLVG